MDDKNKDLPLVVSEILIEMQQMRQEMREDRQQARQQHEELIQVFNRSFDVVVGHFIELKLDVKSLRGTVE